MKDSRAFPPEVTITSPFIEVRLRVIYPQQPFVSRSKRKDETERRETVVPFTEQSLVPQSV